MRSCVICYRERPPRAKKYCRACRAKRIKRQQQASKGVNPDRIRICEDCPASLDDRPRQARLCVRCSDNRRRERLTRYDERNRERRKQAAKANRDNNRESVRRYRETEKGRLAAERAESKPERIEYKRRWKQDHPNPIFFRCPNDWTFDRWLDRIIVDPPKPLPVLYHDDQNFKPFTVPDYLKEPLIKSLALFS